MNNPALRAVGFLLFVMLTFSSLAGEPSTAVQSAAIKFTEMNPITPHAYIEMARAYLAVAAKESENSPNQRRVELNIKAREFRAFTAGLFMAKNADAILACLSWQSLDQVTHKHARYALDSTNTKSNTTYPLLFAAVNLEFSCMTPDEIDRLNKRGRRSSTP